MQQIDTLTTTAVVVPQIGGPDVLDVGPWQLPALDNRDVLVRVEAAGISFADLLMMQGVHPERRPAPFVPGWDVVGTVEAIGSDVTDIAVGDRVIGLTIVGGWARHAIVPATRSVHVPAGLDPTTAVTLAMDYVVAYQMLVRSAQVQPGDTVLVQGAAGGVGTALMQVAAAIEVDVLGTDRGTKRGHVEAHGATLIDFEHEDVVERCRALTAGRGVEAAFDGIGMTAVDSLRAVRRGGTLVWFGMMNFLSGGDRDLGKIGRTAATIVTIFGRNLVPGGKRSKLYSIQRLARRQPGWYRGDLATLLHMLAEGRIDPQIAAVWKLDEVPAAVRGLARGALPGKQVIDVAHS